MALPTPTPPIRSPSLPTDEAAKLVHLIDRNRSSSFPSSAASHSPFGGSNPQQAYRDGLQLPGLSALFPAFSSSNHSNGASAYPTPTSDSSASPNKTPTNRTPTYVSPYASPEQHALITHIDAVRRGFAFHRQCNRQSFVAYDESQAEQVLKEFQGSVADGRALPDSKLCEVFSIAVMASTFNRVQIPAQVADVFYQAASDRIGTWVLSEHVPAMRCCGLLGLSNLFRKATVSLLYFDLGLSLAAKLFPAMRIHSFDMGQPEHVEVQSIWRSLVFCRAWLQSTIGACTSDDQLWLPSTISTECEEAPCLAVRQTVMTQITDIYVIGAKAMRVLILCDSKATLLPAIQVLFGEIGAWYDNLPAQAKASELSQTPWNDTKVCLGYVHLGHLGAITLILRKTLSIYRPKLKGQKHSMQPRERSQVAAILNDGIIAAKQSSRILYLFLGEQASIRHCWAVIYSAFVCASILLYCISQTQLHGYPDSEWRPYLSLVDNNMDILAYCQELDPVAGTLRDTLSQYMQFLRVSVPAPSRPHAPPPWARANLDFPSRNPEDQHHQTQDLVDLLLVVPAGRAGPAQTSLDLLKLVCQPFSDADEARCKFTSGYGIPKVLGAVSRGSLLCDGGAGAGADADADAWMPYGWQQHQSSAAFTGKATNLALTMAQQEMLRAGV